MDITWWHYHSSFVFWFACRIVWSEKYRYFGGGSISVIITTLTVSELQKQPLIVLQCTAAAGAGSWIIKTYWLVFVLYHLISRALNLENSSHHIDTGYVYSYLSSAHNPPSRADISVRRMHGENAARRGDSGGESSYNLNIYTALSNRSYHELSISDTSSYGNKTADSKLQGGQWNRLRPVK